MDDKQKWTAILNNDKSFDGRFFYAVTTTGVFCRPSCASKAPLEQNVQFFDTVQQAQEAGFRPCKRCRPDLAAHDPALEIAEKAKAEIERSFSQRDLLSGELDGMGLSSHRLTEIFQAQYGLTPAAYADRLRLQAAKERLDGSGNSVLEIALSLGFESVSSFYGFFHRHAGLAPGSYRHLQRRAEKQPGFLYELSFGKTVIAAEGPNVTVIKFTDGVGLQALHGSCAETDLAARQLEEYFAGRRRDFDFPILPAGTPFQQQVWRALREIPYGQTVSYGGLAARIGNPKASRAVGMANNKNPLMVVVPCHRVLGANGALVGYAAGLEIKERLLRLERETLGNDA